MTGIKNVIVVGANGNLGPTVVESLLKAKTFNVSVLTRHSTSGSTFPTAVKVFTSDYSESSLEEAFKGQDAIVSAIAGSALGDQKKLIDAAVKAGVKRFIPSEFGGNTANKTAVELVPVFSRKVEIVEYLKSQESKLTWTGIVTGPFFDRSLKLGFLGFDIINQKATIYDSGDRKFTSTTIESVGTGVVGVLNKPEETKNKYVYIGSFTSTQNEVLSVLEKVTGKKWSVQHTTSEEKIKDGKEKVARRDSSAIRPLVTAATYNEKGGSNFEADEGLSNDLLGLPKESLESVIKSVVA